MFQKTWEWKMFEREQYQIQITENMKSLFISPHYIYNETD